MVCSSLHGADTLDCRLKYALAVQPQVHCNFNCNSQAAPSMSSLCVPGTRSVQMLYRAVLFTFIPTALEFAFVIGLLGTQFSSTVAGLVAVTFVAYVAWTLAMTQVGLWAPHLGSMV